MSRVLGLCVCALILVLGRSWAQTSDPGEFFETRIRPTLASNCFACHTNSKLGGLQLDSREAMLKGGQSGPALVPGNPEASLLIRAITHSDEGLKMPLGAKLKEQEIADLTTWVQMGAPWPERPVANAISEDITLEQRRFWSFQPLSEPAVPEVKDRAWARSNIDRFILRELEQRGIRPAEPADRRVLIRRATLDLTGVPPTPEEVDAFMMDESADAFAKVVDRLLGSPRYGERWGRYWLDVARYGEDDVRSATQESYKNAWRYRDWVIDALNRDMPYDLFVKAQLAGDLITAEAWGDLRPATGFFALGPWYYDIAEPPQARADERHDRVDATTRGFLGLTVGCARCHDHKYDPISMRDYYALAGIFGSSVYTEYPIAPQDVVTRFRDHQARIKGLETEMREYRNRLSQQLSHILARKTADYMTSVWKVLGPLNQDVVETAQADALDEVTLERWIEYLRKTDHEHGYLKQWSELLQEGGDLQEATAVADQFQSNVLALLAEKKDIDEENKVLLAQSASKKDLALQLPNGFATYDDYCPTCLLAIKPISRPKYLLWLDLFSPEQPAKPDDESQQNEKSGVLFYGNQLERFLSGEWKSHLEELGAGLEMLKKTRPTEFEFIHGIAESPRPANLRLHLRGSPYNLGPEAPRGFLAILSDAEPRPFEKGSGRLELAQAIAAHPLTARVIANRIWRYHFGRGIVQTSSNFGQLGDRPSHPELLEYLASRLVTMGWSLKALHREIMLSSAYGLSGDDPHNNSAKDPENRYYWHFGRHRLDVEAIRDSILFISGEIDNTIGGPSQELNDDNRRRTVYARISRFRLNPFLSLFDFPDPGISSEQRNATNVPLQRLFFMNSGFVTEHASKLSERIEREVGSTNRLKIRRAYRLLFSREPTKTELTLAEEFLRNGKAEGPGSSSWAQFVQVLFTSTEFLMVE